MFFGSAFHSSGNVTRRNFLATAATASALAFSGLFATQGASAFAADSAIRHKFFLLDEPKRQLVYVDEANPAKNWAMPIEGGPAWSMQLVGNNRILLALTAKGGYCEYDLATKKRVRENFNKARYSGAISAIRLADGRTILACAGGGRAKKPVRLFFFDANDKETSELSFSQISSLRLVRVTPQNTLLLGSDKDLVLEVSLEGKVLREAHIPDAKYTFQVSSLGNGHLLASCGYAGFLAELDAQNKIVRKFGGRPEPAGVKFIFMSQFQRLKNGNTVVATWTGHSAKDSQKGQQLVEFDPQGRVVWQWHDPRRVGSVLGVIVADDINPSQFQPAY